MILYQKRFVTIAEVFFDEPAPAGGSNRIDIVRYRECRNRVSGTVAYTHPTIEIDLRPEPKAILAQMRTRARRKIRHAEIPGDLTCESGVDPAFLQDFVTFFDRFAVFKRLPAANRERMQALLAHNMLDLSRVVETNPETGERQVLAFHAHSLAASTARLLYSATALSPAGERQQPGEQQRPERVPDANTWLHWQDMLRFREAGIQTYDMGGWHDGQDPELLRLNYFKESFGGQVAPRYYADEGVTLRGKAAVLARRIQGRLRGNR